MKIDAELVASVIAEQAEEMQKTREGVPPEFLGEDVLEEVEKFMLVGIMTIGNWVAVGNNSFYLGVLCGIRYAEAKEMEKRIND